MIEYEYQGKKYPVIMSTVDAVVFTWDRDDNLCVAMVKRKDNGKFALPGGYVNYQELLMDAAIRELKEETNLVMYPELCREYHVFDSPTRSTVGNRKITTAFVFRLSGRGGDMPPMTAGDDAADALWIKYQDLKDMNLKDIHDDHFNIIDQSIKFI